MTPDPPVALVLRALYLGDLLTGIPALRMLREALPEHRLVLAAPPKVGVLATLAGVVDEVTPALELSPLSSAPCGADVAVDMHGNGAASRALLEATRPRRVVAWSGGPYRWRPDEHEVRRWCRLVGEAFGVPEPWPGVAGSLPFPARADVPAEVAVVHPGSKARAKQWPPERFAALAAALRDQGDEVVVTGTTAERELVCRVAGLSGARTFVGRPLLDLLALVGSARLLVSGDTGVAHVASAYRTPSVVLFGPVPPTTWGPPDDPRHRVLWHGVMDRSAPRVDGPDPGLLGIEVAEVLEAVASVRRFGRLPRRPRRG